MISHSEAGSAVVSCDPVFSLIAELSAKAENRAKPPQLACKHHNISESIGSSSSGVQWSGVDRGTSLA